MKWISFYFFVKYNMYSMYLSEFTLSELTQLVLIKIRNLSSQLKGTHVVWICNGRKLSEVKSHTSTIVIRCI